MEWLPDVGGLQLARRPSAVEQVRLSRAVRRFIESRKGEQTASMAARMTDGVKLGHLWRDTVEQFSKWCAEWDDTSTYVGSVNAAEELSRVLFGEVVPRMRDPDDRRIADADQQWAAFCQRLTAQRG